VEVGVRDEAVGLVGNAREVKVGGISSSEVRVAFTFAFITRWGRGRGASRFIS
jgi:hypothetical protein